MDEGQAITERWVAEHFKVAVVSAMVWIAVATFLKFDMWLQMAGPLVSMLWYLAAFKRQDADALRCMFADSMYYLGFLLTVASLVCSLVPYVLDDADPEPRHMLGRFGVALSTTLVGIASRIWLTAFEPGTDALECEARDGIREQARALESALGDSLKIFETFNESLGANLESVVDRLRESVESLHTTFADTLRTTLAESHEQLLATMRKTAGSMEESMGAAYDRLGEAMAEATGTLERSLGDTVDSVDQAVQALTGRLGSIELDPTVVQDAVIQSFGGISLELETVSGQLRETREELAENLERVRAAMSGTAELDANLLGLREAGESLKGVGQEMATVTERFNALHGSLNSAIAGSGRIAERIEAQSRNLHQFTEHTGQMAREMGGYLEQVRRLVTGLDGQGRRLEGYGRGVEREISKLQAQNTEFFNSLYAAAKNYEKALVDIGTFIADSMKEIRGTGKAR